MDGVVPADVHVDRAGEEDATGCCQVGPFTVAIDGARAATAHRLHRAAVDA